MVFVLWMTGRPCSGKTTISKGLERIIPNLAVLDGDALYDWLGTYDFSREARISQNERVAHLAKLLIKHDVPVCVSLISPYQITRDNARKILCNENFFLIYINCNISECEKRDVKGMYKKARAGEIKNFTGIDDVFEEPNNSDLILDAGRYTVEECIKKLLCFLKEKKIDCVKS